MVGTKSRSWLILRYVGLLSVLAVMIFPLLWMFRIAFSEPGAAIDLLNPFAGSFTMDNFSSLITSGFLSQPLINSAIIALVVTLGNCLFCFMVGYSMARYRYLENRLTFVMVVAVLMIPVHVTIIPLYLLSLKLHIFDTLWALILPFLVQPLGIFLVKQYVESIPPSMEEAARVDGAGELTILFRVVMPLCKPALAVLAIQIFFTNWNSFLFPFILTSRSELHTLPVALAMLQGHQAIDWPHLMAGSAIAVLPVLVIFVFLQRHIISGISAGAVKQ